MNYDGYVVVQTKLDTKQLEKDIKTAERQLRQYDKEAESLSKQKAKAEVDLQGYEEAKRSIQEMTDASLKYAQTTKEVENVLSGESSLLNDLDTKYSKQLAKLSEINQKIKENQLNQGLLNNEVGEMNKKLAASKGFDNIKSSIDKVSEGMSKTLKKVAKWGLAVFGIRTAYMAVRQAMSTLSQYDETLAADVEYIRYALATVLEPVIKRLINLVYTLMQYVNYLSQAWFGVNLFANASVKNFKKAGAAAKDMSKSLAGFDEMNVVSDSGAGGGAGGAAPSFDLTAPEDVKIPSWLEWLAKNGELIIGIIAGITAAIIVLKLTALSPVELLITGIIVAVALLAAVVIKYWDEIKAALIKVATWINDNVIQPVIKFFKELWEKIVEIFTPVIEFFKRIFTTVWENIKTSFNNIVEIFKFVWNKIKEIFEPVVNFLKDVFTRAFNKIKEVFNPIVNFFGDLWERIKGKLKDWGTKVGEVVGGAFKTAINAVLKAVENILNSPIKAINSLISTINKIPGINLTKLSTFSLPRLARGGIINMPGRGIPVGGAIAGEAGREGVIPLTNSQQMELLGEAIGKYITINANITNTMNGRVISREIQKIQNDSDFAANI